MLQLIDQVSDEVRSAWRFRWAAMGLAATVAVVGWAAVFALPDRYEANARVFVDTHTALKPVLQGLTVEQDVNAQLNFVRQSLLAGPQLQKIAEQSGVLTAAVVDPREQAKILEDLSRRIELTVHSASDQNSERDSAGSIYDISYLDDNRARSLKVVSTLLNTLVEQTLGGKRVGSENAQKFLETQIRDYEQRLRAAEDKLADFKKANIGLMPTEQGGYFAQLQAELMPPGRPRRHWRLRPRAALNSTDRYVVRAWWRLRPAVARCWGRRGSPQGATRFPASKKPRRGSTNCCCGSRTSTRT